MPSNSREWKASSPKQFTRDEPAKVTELMEYRMKSVALIMEFTSSECRILWKLSSIFYRSVKAPAIIHDSSKLLKMFKSVYIFWNCPHLKFDMYPNFVFDQHKFLGLVVLTAL